MSRTPSDYLRAAIEPLILAGSVELLQDERPFIDLIEKNFPFVGSKIDWDRVPGAVTKKLNAQSFVSECLEFLKDRLKQTAISQSAKVVVLGDSAMEQAVATHAGMLETLMPEVLELPQHTYVIALGGEWCMTFTMEGYADFGYSCKEALS